MKKRKCIEGSNEEGKKELKRWSTDDMETK